MAREPQPSRRPASQLPARTRTRDTWEVSRRALLLRGGAFALGLTQIGNLLEARGLLEPALAAESDLTRDTFAGLTAFIVPGRDPYSHAQGQYTIAPGGVDTGAHRALIQTLDFAFAPARVSPLIAGLLNQAAHDVNPTASRGGFASAFARLSFREKAEVFRRLESDPTIAGTAAGYVIGLLPGAAANHSYNEVTVLDRATRTLSRRPIGWKLTGYGGPSDGSRQLLGYWKGHRRARTDPAYRRVKGSS
jgi:hypothetical protein